MGAEAAILERQSVDASPLHYLEQGLPVHCQGTSSKWQECPGDSR